METRRLRPVDPRLDPARVLPAHSVGRGGELQPRPANPHALDIELKGAGAVRPVARTLVLTSAGINDENSFETPERIMPTPGTIDNAAPAFQQTLAPNYVTVLRLQVDNR